MDNQRYHHGPRRQKKTWTNLPDGVTPGGLERGDAPQDSTVAEAANAITAKTIADSGLKPGKAFTGGGRTEGRNAPDRAQTEPAERLKYSGGGQLGSVIAMGFTVGGIFDVDGAR